MKRTIVGLLLIGGLVLGLSAPADAAPDRPDSTETVTHPIPVSEQRAICTYIRPASPGYYLYALHGIHYGSAHVVQCAFVDSHFGIVRCRQYVYNIPNPWYDEYPQASSKAPYCWIN